MSRRGFTLIELMIAVAVMGVLAGGLIPLLPRYLRQVALMNQARGEIARSAQTALYLLGGDVRGAAAVEGEWREHKSGEGRLILRLPDADRIVYYADPRDPKQLVKQVFTAPGSRRHAARQVLARDLKRLRFTVSDSPSGAKLVSYEMTFASGYSRRTFNETFRGAAGLRNGN